MTIMTTRHLTIANAPTDKTLDREAAYAQLVDFLEVAYHLAPNVVIGLDTGLPKNYKKRLTKLAKDKLQVDAVRDSRPSNVGASKRTLTLGADRSPFTNSSGINYVLVDAIPNALVYTYVSRSTARKSRIPLVVTEAIDGVLLYSSVDLTYANVRFLGNITGSKYHYKLTDEIPLANLDGSAQLVHLNYLTPEHMEVVNDKYTYPINYNHAWDMDRLLWTSKGREYLIYQDGVLAQCINPDLAPALESNVPDWKPINTDNVHPLSRRIAKQVGYIMSDLRRMYINNSFEEESALICMDSVRYLGYAAMDELEDAVKDKRISYDGRMAEFNAVYYISKERIHLIILKLYAIVKRYASVIRWETYEQKAIQTFQMENDINLLLAEIVDIVNNDLELEVAINVSLAV